MERELPSAFLLPGSVSLSGRSGSFFFFLTDEGRNWRSNQASSVCLCSYQRSWLMNWILSEYAHFATQQGWKNDKETDITEDGKDPIACLFLGPPPGRWVLDSSQDEIGRYVTQSHCFHWQLDSLPDWDWSVQDLLPYETMASLWKRQTPTSIVIWRLFPSCGLRPLTTKKKKRKSKRIRKRTNLSPLTTRWQPPHTKLPSPAPDIGACPRQSMKGGWRWVWLRTGGCWERSLFGESLPSRGPLPPFFFIWERGKR